MTIKVVRGKVDSGERVYLLGESIVGLSEHEEKELVDLGVCRYTIEDKAPEDSQIPEPSAKTDDLPEGLVQVARGSYQLPNGEKVQGKAKAIEALEAYNAELAASMLGDDGDQEPGVDDPENGGPNTGLPE